MKKLFNSTLLSVVILLMLFVPSVIGACKLGDRVVSAVGLQKTVLSVSEAGRYSIRVVSLAGASLQMVDRIKGPGLEYGVAGAQDGRLDTFLDAGEYQLIIKGSGDSEDTVEIIAEPFKTVTDRDVQLPGIDPLETTLHDLESLDFWLTLSQTQMVYIDAAGRSLEDMRLWLNGSWLTDIDPIVSLVEDNSGQSLKRHRFLVRCPAGTHKVTVYGGKPLPWAYGGTSSPLYIRTGIASAAAAGSISRNISVFGDDIFLMDSGADFFRLDSLSLGTGMSVERITSDDTIQLESFYTLKISDLRTPSVQRTMPNYDSRKLVVVSGHPGSSYQLTWFRVNHANPAFKQLDGVRDVTFFHGGNPRDQAELNAIIIEENKQTPRQENVLASERIDVEPTIPVYRRFNASKPTSFFVWFKEAGKYTLHSRGSPCRFVLETFHTHKPNDYVRPLPQNFPATVEVNTYICRLTIEPDKPGLVELAFLGQDNELDWRALELSPRHISGYAHFPGLTFTNQKQYLFFTNDLNVKTGVFIGKATLENDILPTVFEPETIRMPSRQEKPAAKITVLEPEKQILIDKKPGITQQIHIPISETGVYQFTAKSRFQSSFKLRSAMQTDINGYQEPNAGNLAILRQYLTKGDYFIDISAAPNIGGPMTVSCQKLRHIHMGQIEPGDMCRTELADLAYADATIVINEPGSYHIVTAMLDTAPLLRIVDSNGWPLAVQTEEIILYDVDAGRYSLTQIASPFIDASRISVGRATDTDTLSPSRTSLAKTIKGFWTDTENEPWTFQLQAETRLSVRLSPGMIGQIRNAVSDDPAADIPENSVWKGSIPAGDWNLFVESAFPDNLKPYTIDISADPLVSGTRARIQCPGSIDLRVGGHEAQFAIITVNADIDIRAVLTCSDGSVIATSDDIPGDWNPYMALWLQPGDTTLFVEPIRSEDHEIDVTFTIPTLQTIQWPESGLLSVTPGNDAIFIPLDSFLHDTLTAVSVVSNSMCGITELPANTSAISPVVSVARNHVFFPIQTEKNGCIVWSVDGRMEPVHLEKTMIPISRQSDRADGVSLKWGTKAVGDAHIAISAVSIEKKGAYLLETQKGAPLFFQAKAQEPFQRVHGEKTTLYSTDGFLFAQAFSIGDSPASTTLKRQTLTRDTPGIEWFIAPNDQVWVDVALGKKDEAVAHVSTGADEIEIGLDGDWTQNVLGKSSSESTKNFLISGGNNRQIGFRTSSAGSGGAFSREQEPLALTVSFFDHGKAVELTASIGTYQLQPGAMAIVQTRDAPNCYADQGVFIGAFDSKRRHVKFYNTTNHVQGIAWSNSEGMTPLPETIVVKDAPVPEIFLGPGMIQRYTFTLPESKEIGIYVDSSSGYIRPALLDAIGNRLVEGLMIHKYLEAGTYTLSIQNPTNRQPAKVQPVFVLKTPENLTLFGMED